MKPEEIVELIDAAKAYKPAIPQIVSIIEECGEEIAPLIDKLVIYTTDKKAESVKRLMEKHSFSKEEAILLTVDTSVSILKQLREIK